MNISKSHKLLSERLNNPRVLTNPEEFLGPNYRAVLNFWLFLDDLTEEQWRTIISRYWYFYRNQSDEWYKAIDEARKTSDKIIGKKFAFCATLTSSVDYYSFDCASHATGELIGMHLLLDQQKPLIFFNMFLEVL